MKSAFVHNLKFETPADQPALPTYRVVDQHGVVVDQSFTPDLRDEEVIKLYKDMLYISIMDLIMFDAQRQGRLSFYMVSAGEEALSIGTASALAKEDVVFCQYREQGVFRQRGFSTADFMNQLFANKRDPGKGRNMPVHYGSKELNIVSAGFQAGKSESANNPGTAHNFVSVGNSAATGLWCCLRHEGAKSKRSLDSATGSGGVLWGGRSQRGGFPRRSEHGGDSIMSCLVHLPQ